LATPAFAEWRAEIVSASAAITALETIDGEVRVGTARGWFRVSIGGGGARLEPSSPPRHPPIPPNALPDARIATGRNDIARAWFAGPTTRYSHGVLGDAIEASSLVVENKSGERDALTLGTDAVFEDIEPRIANLGRNGEDNIIAVKSYLTQGSALAVIGRRDGKLAILAETPPIGRPNAWLNPAGIADFDGDGTIDIALVRQPHVLGRLELWSWRDGTLHKAAEVSGAANHFIGSRVLRMSAAADFDGDGVTDLAVPALDRRTLRIIAFKPRPRDIARISLPSRVVTEIGLVTGGGTTMLAMGLEDGRLALVRR
jgi:hypothetical protein